MVDGCAECDVSVTRGDKLRDARVAMSPRSVAATSGAERDARACLGVR